MNPISNSSQNPITEDDIANFLANTPDFFERHAQLLATVQLSSGHGSRAVSLQERQAGMLRDKIRGLESRLVEMIRHGQDNVAIADKLQAWTRQILLTAAPQDLPEVMLDVLQRQFSVPQAAIKVWDVAAPFDACEFVLGANEDARSFASGLALPYCGVNAAQPALTWLPEPAAARSVALIPLREPDSLQAFGLLVLASDDAERFHSGMGTDFLQRIGELASAALSRLRQPAPAPIP
jgi:uncharacterized protein YigA (DUF484 family)